MIKIKEIKPDQRNTNKHTQSGMALLEKSVEKVGVIESYTVSSDDVIISGNARHEVLGRKFDKEPIVVEIEGDQPVVIKRMDIKSGTKMFHEASILANTTAHKNFNLDHELIEE
jgi:CMP-2-keto-3-deoxyoctulosonic acid synthetase